MLEARFVHVQQWPGKPRNSYRQAQFRTTYAKTLALLEAELRTLRARKIVIQAYFPGDKIRNDGWPYSNARPDRPGVIVSFESAKGPLSFPCDTYGRWEDNLRAVALSLEALRSVDRHGVTQNNEQYRGWQQLAAPGTRSHFTSAEEAADFIIIHSGVAYGQGNVLRDPAIRKECYRKAAYNLHPDRGGHHDQFTLLQEALAVLEAT